MRDILPHLLVLVLLLGIHVFLKIKPNLKGKSTENILLLIVFIIIIFLFSFKSLTSGTDTGTYHLLYVNIINKPLKEVLLSSKKEHGFLLIEYFFSKLNINFHFFLLFCYMFSLTSIYFLIIGLSKNRTLSTILFITYEFYAFFNSALRNAIALGFVALALLIFIKVQKKRRYLFFYLLVLIASTFHISALSALIIPLLAKINYSYKFSLYFLLTVILSYFIGPFILDSLNNFERLGTLTSINIGGTVVLLFVISFFAYIFYSQNNFRTNLNIFFSKILKKKKDKNTFSEIIVGNGNANELEFSNISINSVAFATLVIIVASVTTFERFSYSFRLLLIFLIPNIIDYQEDRLLKNIIEVFSIMFFVIYFLFYILLPRKLGLGYEFAWI